MKVLILTSDWLKKVTNPKLRKSLWRRVRWSQYGLLHDCCTSFLDCTQFSGDRKIAEGWMSASVPKFWLVKMRPISRTLNVSLCSLNWTLRTNWRTPKLTWTACRKQLRSWRMGRLTCRNNLREQTPRTHSWKQSSNRKCLDAWKNWRTPSMSNVKTHNSTEKLTKDLTKTKEIKNFKLWLYFGKEILNLCYYR